MAKEIISIINNHTWVLTNRPEHQTIIGRHMVLRNMYKADGILDRRKARLVAQGFRQEPGIDYN